MVHISQGYTEYQLLPMLHVFLFYDTGVFPKDGEWIYLFVTETKNVTQKLV